MKQVFSYAADWYISDAKITMYTTILKKILLKSKPDSSYTARVVLDPLLIVSSGDGNGWLGGVASTNVVEENEAHSHVFVAFHNSKSATRISLD